MIEAQTPRNESQRLEALHCLGILDSANEHRFDHIVQKARELFDVPVALISLVDRDRQWFKARVGLRETETPRDISFCSHALSGDKPVVVEDALLDSRFHDNPLVTGEFNLRFYAGYPIHSSEGYPLGTLCIIDHSPRTFDSKDLRLLQHLAQLVDKEIASTPLREDANTNSPGDRFGEFLQRTGNFLSRRHVSLVLAGSIFLGALFGLSGYYVHTLETRYLELHNKTSERLFNIRGRLETELNARLHLTHGLAGLVRAAPDQIDREAFQSFAKDLGNNLSGIRSLQLAPDAVVRYLWPEDINSPALGHDLLADPKRRAVAQKSVQSRELWIAGPLELIQGGTALIGRLPVFLPTNESQEASNAERFWGFATVLVDLDSLLEIADFHSLSENFNVAIRGHNGLGQNGDVFVGSQSVFSGRYLSASVALPAGSWEIGISIPPSPTVRNIPFGVWALFASSSLVIAAALYTLMRLPFRYQRAVNSAKQALATNNARFKDAIEALPDGFAIFDDNDLLVRCNQRYREFFAQEDRPISMGVPFEEVLRDSVNAGIYALPEGSEEAQEQFCALRMAHHRDPTAEGMELEISEGRWLRAVESRVPSGGTVIAYTDVSELKKKEHELQAEKRKAESANEAKTAFLATVSHELRTPLNAILGLLNLIQMSGRLQQEDQEYIDLTHDSAEHLLNLLNELLDLSKMEAGKLELECNDFNLASVARKALKLCDNKAKHKNLALIDDIAADAEVMVKGDAGRLQQILLNLLTNGIKFTDQGSVTLSISIADSTQDRLRCRFKVRDTGMGFSESQADTLFQPFRQLDSSASRKHEGTGLGLAICKRLTGIMGGHIEARGEPGTGATFEFEIPLQLTKEIDPEKVSATSSEVTLPSEMEVAPIRVLIAEDSPANQIVFKAMLQETGYYADVVGNGLEAIRAVDEFQYDVILMDIFMPEMDGIEATRVIRQSKAMNSKPIIALTANAMPGDQEKFLNVGMDDYLAKPVNKEMLIRMLNKWTILRERAH